MKRYHWTATGFLLAASLIMTACDSGKDNRNQDPSGSDNQKVSTNRQTDQFVGYWRGEYVDEVSQFKMTFFMRVDSKKNVYGFDTMGSDEKKWGEVDAQGRFQINEEMKKEWMISAGYEEWSLTSKDVLVSKLHYQFNTEDMIGGSSNNSENSENSAADTAVDPDFAQEQAKENEDLSDVPATTFDSLTYYRLTEGNYQSELAKRRAILSRLVDLQKSLALSTWTISDVNSTSTIKRITFSKDGTKALINDSIKLNVSYQFEGQWLGDETKVNTSKVQIGFESLDDKNAEANNLAGQMLSVELENGKLAEGAQIKSDTDQQLVLNRQ